MRSLILLLLLAASVSAAEQPFKISPGFVITQAGNPCECALGLKCLCNECKCATPKTPAIKPAYRPWDGWTPVGNGTHYHAATGWYYSQVGGYSRPMAPALQPAAFMGSFSGTCAGGG